LIRSYRGRTPQIPASAYIDPDGGNYRRRYDRRTLERWPGVVIRGERQLDSHRRALNIRTPNLRRAAAVAANHARTSRKIKQVKLTYAPAAYKEARQ